MPRASKRGKVSEHGISEKSERALASSQLTSLGKKDVKQEDSSEAASAITLVPYLPQLKNQQEASNPFLGLSSLSTQSSQGGENLSQIHSPPRMECCGTSQPAAELIDLRKDIAWAFCSKQLDEGVASLLRNQEIDTVRHVQTVASCSKGEAMGGRYLRLEETEEVEPVTCQIDFKSSTSEHQDATAKRMMSLVESQPPIKLGSFWEKKLVSTVKQGHNSAAVEQVIQTLSCLLPKDVLPITAAQTSPRSWLAFSNAGQAATDLRLQIGSSLWASGFTKDAAALGRMYLSIPKGINIQEAMQQHGVSEAGHRRWVVQEDPEALAGSELVLRAWRAESCGQEPSAVGHTWEEVDSKAVVFGARNELGAARDVLQEPGQVLASQRQGHCSYASGGIFLSWNVAYGASWPAHALREGNIRSNAVRRAAVFSRNAWLAYENKPAPTLHILRLLFAVACNLDEAHESLVDGLQETFLPLCKADIEEQSRCNLPQMNARKGILESHEHSGLRCSCCFGEFLFSFVCLVKRKGERGGSLCWQCWGQREEIGLERSCRNARKCLVLQQSDLWRLINAISSARPMKRARLS